LGGSAPTTSLSPRKKVAPIFGILQNQKVQRRQGSKSLPAFFFDLLSILIFSKEDPEILLLKAEIYP
jgi:hypothetical protein